MLTVAEIKPSIDSKLADFGAIDAASPGER
jgi:hypothetical protein